MHAADDLYEYSDACLCVRLCICMSTSITQIVSVFCMYISCVWRGRASWLLSEVWKRYWGTAQTRNRVPSSVCMLRTNRPAGGRVSVRHAWLPCFNFPPFENISRDKGREVQRDLWTNRAEGERERKAVCLTERCAE